MNVFNLFDVKGKEIKINYFEWIIARCNLFI